MTSRTTETSFSEISRLAQCEQSWWYRYEQHQKDAPGLGAQLGRLIGTGTRAWWDSSGPDPMMSAVSAMGDEFAQLNGRRAELVDIMSDPYSKALWLMGRYDRHYASRRDEIEVVGSEVNLKAVLPGTNVEVTAYFDHLWRIENRLLLVERKTMKDWSRLDLLLVDPQITLYDWIAKENGLDIWGIAYDAIRTYRWKLEKPTQKVLIEEAAARGVKLTRDQARAAVEADPGRDRPDHESFDMLWLDRTTEQHKGALDWATRAMTRRLQLQVGRENPVIFGDWAPIRNIGPLCKACSYQPQCFEEMAFPSEIVMEEE